MANSLVNLLSVSGGPVRFIVQADRRQLSERRRIWRGGRRASDHPDAAAATRTVETGAAVNGGLTRRDARADRS